MKTSILFTVFLVVSISFSQQINFTDANFKAKLLEANDSNQIASTSIFGTSNFVSIDTNGDGEIEVSEAQLIKYLNVSNSAIASLAGIENFTNLSNLNASHNELTEVNLLGQPQMYMVKLNNNQITTILYDNKLENFDLSYNQLTSFVLNTHNNPLYHQIFNLSHNQLTSIVFNDGVNENLNLSHNLLSSIDLNGIQLSVSINLRNNLFTSINFSGVEYVNTSAEDTFGIFIGNNINDAVVFGDNAPRNIYYTSNNTFFDLENYNRITDCNSQNGIFLFDCPNLQQVSLKNGFNHVIQMGCSENGILVPMAINQLHLSIVNCPSLNHICTDEVEKPYVQDLINQMNLDEQIQVNSYCSFTPGGSYNILTGNITFDENNNGCDVDDLSIKSVYFQISGDDTGSIYPTSSGNFSVALAPGNYLITPQIENSTLFSISPSSVSLDIPNQNGVINQNFCIQPLGNQKDLELIYFGLSTPIPGFDTSYKLILKNIGNQTLDGMVLLTFEDDVVDFISATPSMIQNGNQLSYSFTGLKPFENSDISLLFNLNTPTETPTLNNGDVLTFSSVSMIENDINPENNTFVLNQTVVNSFDPNDKTCLEGTSVSPSKIGDFLHYLIRFENIGTAEARNVVIEDIIDTEKFNIASLTPIKASHSFFTKVTGNKIEFIFENINLPFEDEQNDGYVLFKIKTLSSLIENDVVSNMANIYFDFNFPIQTNTAQSTFETLSNTSFESSDDVILYPNPMQNELNLHVTKSNIEIKTMAVFSMIGQKILEIEPINNKVDVSKLAPGFYIITCKTNEATVIKKFRKE